MAVSAAAAAAGSARKADVANAQAYELTRGREDALRNTIAKQDAYAKESAATLTPVRDDVANDAAARAAAAQGREAAYEAAAAPPAIAAAPAAVGTGAPAVVTTELNRRLAQGAANSKADATRRAALDAYGDVGVGRGSAISAAREKIALNNNFSQGEAALLPGQFEALKTNIDNRGEDMLGKGLSTVGQLGFLYGTTRPTNRLGGSDLSKYNVKKNALTIPTDRGTWP
jgi:hypothetical protein